MHYHPLGNTGLAVSVAGLGCGGNSRLGLGRGASFDECVGVARAAIDLAVNFRDTAEVYGTEEIMGAAVKPCDCDKLVISIKALFKTADMADRPPRALKNDEVLDLGGKRVRWLDTPHVPHNWDAGLIYEERTGTLFSSDLFIQTGPADPTTESDIVAPAIAVADGRADATPPPRAAADDDRADAWTDVQG